MRNSSEKLVDSTEAELEPFYATSGANKFGFTQQEFCALVMDVMNRSVPATCSTRERKRFLQTLRLDELVLARACACGNETAWDEFLARYREKLYTAAALIAKEESIARELAGSLSADLFGTRVRADGHRICKLDSYLGRGSLEGWLRTVLAQEYVNRFRSQRKLVSFDEAISTRAAAGLGSEHKPENERVAKATDRALASLSSEERLLLAAYYLDGRTLAEIGGMLKLHESTISRRLEKIAAALRRRIVALLCEAGITKRTAEEMLDLDVRDLNVDVRSRLAQERQG